LSRYPNLEFRGYNQSEKTRPGRWEPTWSWFGNYPVDWEQAKTGRRGVLTLDTLLSLRVFGCIEAGGMTS